MELFNNTIRNNYLEILKTNNMNENFIKTFDEYMTNKVIENALDMITQGALKNREFCEMGKTMISMYTKEKEINSPLFVNEPVKSFELVDMSKLTIPKTKIKETIALLESLLNEEKVDKKAKATKATKADKTEKPEKATKTTKTTKSTKSLKVTNTVPIEAKAPVFTEDILNNNLELTEVNANVNANAVPNITIHSTETYDISEEELNKHLDMLNLTELPKLETNKSQEFNPISISEINTDLKIDSQMIADSILSTSSPFHIAKRISNN